MFSHIKGKNVNRQDGQYGKINITSIVVTRLLSIICSYCISINCLLQTYYQGEFSK